LDTPADRTCNTLSPLTQRDTLPSDGPIRIVRFPQMIRLLSFFKYGVHWQMLQALSP